MSSTLISLLLNAALGGLLLVLLPPMLRGGLLEGLLDGLDGLGEACIDSVGLLVCFAYYITRYR